MARDGFLPRDEADEGAPCPLVLIVDDDNDVRLALCELMLSVGLAAQAFASTQALLDAPLPDRPGCLILDVRLPGLSGLEVQAMLARRGDSRPIVFLTAHGDIAMSVQAMKAGAVDFLTKPAREQALLDAVSVAVRLDQVRRSGAQAVERRISLFQDLTMRERQVLRGVALGRLNKTIAHELGLSEITIKLHRRTLMRKLNAGSASDLVREWEALPATIRATLDV
jgi:FixJ family two-component response regulator